MSAGDWQHFDTKLAESLTDEGLSAEDMQVDATDPDEMFAQHGHLVHSLRATQQSIIPPKTPNNYNGREVSATKKHCSQEESTTLTPVEKLKPQTETRGTT